MSTEQHNEVEKRLAAINGKYASLVVAQKEAQLDINTLVALTEVMQRLANELMCEEMCAKYPNLAKRVDSGIATIDEGIMEEVRELEKIMDSWEDEKDVLSHEIPF